jgi:hypothetical protein
MKFPGNKSRGIVGKVWIVGFPAPLHGCNACLSKKAVRGHSFRDGASFSNSCQLRFHLSRDGWHLEALIYGQPRESASPPSGVCPMRAVQPDGRRRANSKNRQVIDTTPHFRATGQGRERQGGQVQAASFRNAPGIEDQVYASFRH